MAARSKRFDDPEYVAAFRDRGAFPDIHKDVGYLIAAYASEREPSMDLGACTGLLSHQLVQVRRAAVLAIEPSPAAICAAVPHPLIRFENMRIEDATLKTLFELVSEVKPTLVVARRVLPEIAGQDVGLIHRLTALLHGCGVEKVILEGRRPTPNPVSPLSDVEKEVDALATYFVPAIQYRSCYLLTRKRMP